MRQLLIRPSLLQHNVTIHAAERRVNKQTWNVTTQRKLNMSPFHSYMIARYEKSHFYVCLYFTGNATFSHDVVLGSAQSFFFSCRLWKRRCANKDCRCYYCVRVVWGIIGAKHCLCIPACFSSPFSLNAPISLLLYLFCHRTLFCSGVHGERGGNSSRRRRPSSVCRVLRVQVCVCDFMHTVT